MVRRWFTLGCLLLAGASPGCGICQNCFDRTGPVLDAPNGGHYDESPRANSALGGTPMHEGQVIEGDVIEGESMPVYEESYSGQPTNSGVPATASRTPATKNDAGPQSAKPYPGGPRR